MMKAAHPGSGAAALHRLGRPLPEATGVANVTYQAFFLGPKK